jgi:hypothetical protein
MIGRRAIACLSLLSAFLFCALATQGASAAEAKNTTAFTCVKGGGSLDFKDAHCDETTTAGKGEFGHVQISNGTQTEIEVTNEKTAAGTTSSTPFTLKYKLLSTHFECSTLSGVGTIENSEPTAKAHKVSGPLIIQLSKCTVLKPLKCTLKEPIEMQTAFVGVEGLGAEANNMGVELKPAAGEVFVAITFEGSECSLKGKPINISGTMTATGAPAPNAKESGATWSFSPENEMEALKLGGEPCLVTAAITPRMKSGGNPIALTTTT